MLWSWLNGRRHQKLGQRYYTELLQRSRQPRFYVELGVPDTALMRFELLAFHVAALQRRLADIGPGGRGEATTKVADAVGQALFDAVFHDLEAGLREMGVGDPGVGRRIRGFMAVYNARRQAMVDIWGLNPPDRLPAFEMVLAAALREADEGDEPPSSANRETIALDLLAFGQWLDMLKNENLLSGGVTIPTNGFPAYRVTGVPDGVGEGDSERRE